MKIRKPNSQECLYYGRKLSNFMCDDIEASIGSVAIGSENDDEIYFGECLKPGEEMVKERVTITVSNDDAHDENIFYVDIDLEDVLRFAAKNCNGIYKRVLEENI